MNDMDTLTPYAEGEWLKLETTQAPTSFSTVSFADEEVEEEELPEPDRILRGPIWNYGCRIYNEHFYSNLLFGKSNKTLFTEDELIIKGEEWSPTKPVSISMAKHFLRSLKKGDPKATALVEIETGRSLKYAELEEKIKSVACGLHWLGLQPGQVIAVVTYNSLEAILITLASILVGAIIAPLDAGLNPEDIGTLLRIASPHLIFSESGKTLLKVEVALYYLMTSRQPRLVINSNHSLQPMRHSNHFSFAQLLREVEPDFRPHLLCADPFHPVFILFTSGTTGTPKGALIPERFFMNNRMYMESIFISPGTANTNLLSTPLHWISSITTLLIHLINGHQNVFLRGPPSEAVLINILKKSKVTNWFTGPLLLTQLLEWLARPRCPNLKHIGIIGMKFSAKDTTRVRDELFDKKVHICQMYGLTEVGLMTANTPKENKFGSCGKVFFNVQMKVVEIETGLAVGPNIEGELRFKSKTVMLGYYNNMVDNETSFDNEGFFQTGDLGYYDEEGFVFVTGRIKELIKWKSFQILPLEVEKMLVVQPEIKQALVFGLYDDKDGELVTAAVVLKPQYTNIRPEKIQMLANSHLPDAKKIRGGVHIFQCFPCSSTGRPNRKLVARQVLERTFNDNVSIS